MDYRSALRRRIEKKEEENIPNKQRSIKRISFSERKSIRTFSHEEEPKKWDNSYELSDHTNGDDTNAALTNKHSVCKVKQIENLVHVTVSENQENLVPNSSLKDFICNSQDNISLRIEHSINLTLLPQEIKSKDNKKASEVLLSTNDSLATSFSFITDAEHKELKRAKSNKEKCDKTSDFMSELNHNTKDNVAEFEEVKMDLSAVMENTSDQMHDIQKSVNEVQLMNISIDKENINPNSTSKPMESEKNEYDKMELSTECAINNFEKQIVSDEFLCNKSTIMNGDLSIVENENLDKINGNKETQILDDSTFDTSLSNDFQFELKQQHSQPNALLWSAGKKYQFLKSPEHKVNMKNSDSAEMNVLDDLLFSSPLIPHGCLPADATNKKLNLRKLNEELECGRIQIFPTGPKTPVTISKSKQRYSWFGGDDMEIVNDFRKSMKSRGTLNFNEEIEVSIEAKEDLAQSKLSDTPSVDRKLTYRFSQADEIMLDNTNFLTQAKLGDETQSHNALARGETVHFQTDLDLDNSKMHENNEAKGEISALDAFEVSINSDNNNILPTNISEERKSRKTLYFENVDMETTCIDDLDQHNDSTIQKQLISDKIISNSTDSVLRNTNIKLKSEFIDDQRTPLTSKSGFAEPKCYQFTPRRSVIEFEDLEQECNESCSVNQSLVIKNGDDIKSDVAFIKSNVSDKNSRECNVSVTNIYNDDFETEDSTNIPKSCVLNESQYTIDINGNSSFPLKTSPKGIISTKDFGGTPKSEKSRGTIYGHKDIEMEMNEMEEKNNQATIFKLPIGSCSKSFKRLPVNLTPHMPTSKKRQTIIFQNTPIEQEEYVSVSTPAKKPMKTSRIPVLRDNIESLVESVPRSGLKMKYILNETDNSVQVLRSMPNQKFLKIQNAPLLKNEILSTLEDNPDIVTDVSPHLLMDGDCTNKIAEILQPSNSDTLESASHEPQEGCCFKKISRFNKKFMNLTTDSDGIENTRLSLVESLIYEDDYIDAENCVLHNGVVNFELVKSIVGEIESSKVETEDAKVELEAAAEVKVEGEENESEQEKNDCSELPNYIKVSSNIFVWPNDNLVKLRHLRQKPRIVDVHQYWCKKLLTNKNESLPSQSTELNSKSTVANIIADYRISLERLRTAEILRMENLQLKQPFSIRLNNLIKARTSNWIFDYQSQAKNIYIFSHKNVHTIQFFVDFESKDIFDADIIVKSFRYDLNRIPKTYWKAYDYIVHFELDLRLPFLLELADGSSEHCIIKTLDIIDSACEETRNICDALWNVVSLNQARLIRDGNRTVIRKIIRNTIIDPETYDYVEKQEFLINVGNIKTISFMDILLPQLYLFSEAVQCMPKGIRFVREFLENPEKYLLKK